jgi:hypothetical protein
VGVRSGEDVGRPADWQEELRARGYRLTPQRQLVLEAVYELEHATPDQILEHVRERASGVNVSTIYRTLELLEEIGLVTHTHLSHGAPTYHSAAVQVGVRRGPGGRRAAGHPAARGGGLRDRRGAPDDLRALPEVLVTGR